MTIYPYNLANVLQEQLCRHVHVWGLDLQRGMQARGRDELSYALLQSSIPPVIQTKRVCVFFPRIKGEDRSHKTHKTLKFENVSGKRDPNEFLAYQLLELRGKSCTLACAHFWSNEACHKKMEKPGRWISWFQDVGSVGDSLSLLH